MNKIVMPEGARLIIEKLNNNGFEAYIVGGCVRDCLLGKTPNDWDITTSAKPSDVKKIFRKTVDTGIQHGTVTVLTNNDAFEVTTYRVDGIYEDHRRPKEVAFTVNLEEDLKRRDFTINAMAYNDEQGVIDIFGGVSDLNNGIIRCVGNPIDRFNEDALRILRAVRFAAQLGFDIDEPTRAAMKNQAKFLKDISAERIQVELTKLITSDHPEELLVAYELGLTAIFLPEFDTMIQTKQNNPYHLYDVGKHTIKVMQNVPANMVLRYAALFHDIGKPSVKTIGEDGKDHFYGHQDVSQKMSEIIMRRLRLDNNTIEQVKRLVLYHDYNISGATENIRSFRRFLAKLGIENFSDFITIRNADISGQSEYNLEARKQSVEDMKIMYERVVSEKQCLKISDLAINGKNLMELGMKPGREMGNILKKLLDMVLDEPEINTKQQLTLLAKKMINNE